MTSQADPAAICPESTLESANSRRSFVKNATLAAAAAAVGSTLLAERSPISSARISGTNGCPSVIGACCVIAGCPSAPSCRFNDGKSPHPGLGFGYGLSAMGIASAKACAAPNLNGLDFYTCYDKRMSITKCGKVGIGTCAPSSTLEVNGPTTLDCTLYVKSKVGIGAVANPCYQLEVVAPNQRAVHIEGPSCYIGAGISFQTTCCSTYNQGWEILDTGRCSGQGPNKLNIRNLNSAKDVFTICGPNSNIGINNTAPFSSYALCVNGTISGSSAGTGVLGATSCGIGVLGCSARCGIGVSGQGGKVGVEAVAATAGAIPIVAKGACGQTANLQQWENSSGTVYAVINRAGSLGLGGVTNPHHVLCISGKAHASSGFSIGPCVCVNTTLAVNGSFAAKTRTVASTTTLLTTDYAILATGTITLTLPPAKTQNGMTIFIKNTSTGTVSVVPGGTDSIEGSSTARTLTKQYDSLQLISNGSNEWYILSGAKCGAFVS